MFIAPKITNEVNNKRYLYVVHPTSFLVIYGLSYFGHRNVFLQHLEIGVLRLYFWTGVSQLEPCSQDKLAKQWDKAASKIR